MHVEGKKYIEKLPGLGSRDDTHIYLPLSLSHTHTYTHTWCTPSLTHSRTLLRTMVLLWLSSTLLSRPLAKSQTQAPSLRCWTWSPRTRWELETDPSPSCASMFIHRNIFCTVDYLLDKFFANPSYLCLRLAAPPPPKIAQILRWFCMVYYFSVWLIKLQDGFLMFGNKFYLIIVPSGLFSVDCHSHLFLFALCVQSVTLYM